MLSSYEELLRLLLPEFILENFELKSARKERDILHIDLEELNSIPVAFEKDKRINAKSCGGRVLFLH